MTGVRRPAALLVAALALAAAPAPAFASATASTPSSSPLSEGDFGSSPLSGGDFGAAATCLQEVAVVPALGSHAAGPSHCANGNVLDHTVGTLGSLTR
ncbi:hypothetical protein ABTX81_20805 [Kitasatospora sp. NPDC097605]|uniref:hypothetical protein n=1 Tax=Kitasatospora sp. NPDC097605 TaxID=3157226 RepID=UPI0033272587